MSDFCGGSWRDFEWLVGIVPKNISSLTGVGIEGLRFSTNISSITEHIFGGYPPKNEGQLDLPLSTFTPAGLFSIPSPMTFRNLRSNRQDRPPDGKHRLEISRLSQIRARHIQPSASIRVQVSLKSLPFYTVGE